MHMVTKIYDILQHVLFNSPTHLTCSALTEVHRLLFSYALSHPSSHHIYYITIILYRNPKSLYYNNIIILRCVALRGFHSPVSSNININMLISVARIVCFIFVESSAQWCSCSKRHDWSYHIFNSFLLDRVVIFLYNMSRQSDYRGFLTPTPDLLLPGWDHYQSNNNSGTYKCHYLFKYFPFTSDLHPICHPSHRLCFLRTLRPLAHFLNYRSATDKVHACKRLPALNYKVVASTTKRAYYRFV